jgi:FKBP-type peptidyl-prolyl cis-trans isomerase FkpA
MRKNLLLIGLICASFGLFSCFKKDTGCSYQKDNTQASTSDKEVLKQYLDSTGIVATMDSNGFYYQIITKGIGTVPGPCSRITVSYVGSLTNGSIFDQQTDALFTLGGLIPGWKQGLPLISKGGEIKLYVPPSLGYGGTAQLSESGSIVIPANSILIFDINLIDVQ